ncbi:hypothetical protein UlMin_024715 [Ulmus minor]
MGLLSNNIGRCMLKEGDHIYAYRNLLAYSHHGIYVGENRVIHYTRTEENTKTSKSKSCKECGFNSNTHRGVVVSCLDCFLQGHSLHRFDYTVSSGHFAFKRSGTCSTGHCDEPSVVVKRAYEMLYYNAFGEYNLLYNNCECFAIYCKTGHSASFQIYSLESKAMIAVEELLRKPISVKNFAKTLFKVGIKYKIDKLEFDISLRPQDN